jgi:hypothetical protein
MGKLEHSLLAWLGNGRLNASCARIAESPRATMNIQENHMRPTTCKGLHPNTAIWQTCACQTREQFRAPTNSPAPSVIIVDIPVLACLQNQRASKKCHRWCCQSNHPFEEVQAPEAWTSGGSGAASINSVHLAQEHICSPAKYRKKFSARYSNLCQISGFGRAARSHEQVFWQHQEE